MIMGKTQTLRELVMKAITKPRDSHILLTCGKITWHNALCTYVFACGSVPGYLPAPVV